MIKLFDLVKRPPGATRAAFLDAWRNEHGARVQEALAGRARRYVQNHQIDGAAVPELVVSGYDVADELWFDSLDALEDAAGDYARVVDRSDARDLIRLVCEESVQFDRGFGRMKFIGLSRRAAGFATRDEWRRYWLDVHGPLAHGVAEFTRYYGRYVHNYVLDHRLESTDEFDGVVEEWLDSVEAMATCLSEPKYLEIVRPDELTFVDFTRSHMLLTEEHVVVEGVRAP
jgi:hypothetical protein